MDTFVQVFFYESLVFIIATIIVALILMNTRRIAPKDCVAIVAVTLAFSPQLVVGVVFPLSQNLWISLAVWLVIVLIMAIILARYFGLWRIVDALPRHNSVHTDNS